MENEKILEIEKRIDEAIENEDFQLNRLLDEREKLIKKGVEKEILENMLNKDKIRINKIKKLMRDFMNQAKELKLGEKALKGYGNLYGINTQGGRFKGKG